jgi:hypothetical protein
MPAELPVVDLVANGANGSAAKAGVIVVAMGLGVVRAVELVEHTVQRHSFKSLLK